MDEHYNPILKTPEAITRDFKKTPQFWANIRKLPAGSQEKMGISFTVQRLHKEVAHVLNSSLRNKSINQCSMVGSYFFGYWLNLN